VPWQGETDRVSELIAICLEEGVLFQPTGRGPTKLRMLPPLNLTDEELEFAFMALARAIRRVVDAAASRLESD
jgi:4-aminobutyrate aminotransferase-like enzyme